MSDLWAAHEDQKEKKPSGRDNSPRANLPRVIRLASGKCLTMTIKRKTVYAMMQPPPLPLPSLSTGVEVVGSKSGPLETMEKRKAK